MFSDPTSLEFTQADIVAWDDTASAMLADVAESEYDYSAAEATAPEHHSNPGNGFTSGAVVEALTPTPATVAAPVAVSAALPLPGTLLIKRKVSGRYRSSGGGFQLELRVDVDGSHTTKRISGDIFSATGSTASYFGSFVVHAPTITTTATQVVVEGIGKFSWAASMPKVKVTIPRVFLLSAPKPATLQFFSLTGAPGAIYLCNHQSGYFRTVLWEQDSVVSTVPFVSYNTGALPGPAGMTPRDLTVAKAFGEAGIEMQTAGTQNIIPTGAAGGDAKWNDSELHAAMVNHFSLWANVPQWRLYLLVATSHKDGYRGIMFDYADASQRQGCAVFYDAIMGASAVDQRAQLRTYVHELGHCFNLLHSWQKNLADPPAPLGPNGGLGDLSWMNYAWKYAPPPPAAGGEAAYWSSFPFQFTTNELIHLRHAFYRDIIPGGNPFGKGAAEVDPEMFADRTEDYSGLQLELRSKGVFAFGEPVVVELKLSTTDTRGKRVHGYLHPNDTLVQLAIEQPSGRIVTYRPLISHCADEDKTVLLNAEQPAIYDSAYVGYGKDGFYFDSPGTYKLRAIYVATDGSRVVSPTHTLRVRSPLTSTDEAVGEMFLGEDQGKLLFLLGSDAPALNAGNAVIDEVIDRFGKHPLAVYARMLKGINAERDFKLLDTDKSLHVRSADPSTSVSQLSAVVSASTKDEGVDNITLNMVMRTMAQAQTKAGDLDKAVATLDKMVDVFEAKKLKPQVIDQIQAEADMEKAKLEEVTKGNAGVPRKNTAPKPRRNAKG